MVTAYVVAAYAIGRELTKFQVSLVNILFFLFTFLGASGQFANVEVAYDYGRDRATLIGKEPVGELGDAAYYVFMITRILIGLGALTFMWQVRHPKSA